MADYNRMLKLAFTHIFSTHKTKLFSYNSLNPRKTWGKWLVVFQKLLMSPEFKIQGQVIVL